MAKRIVLLGAPGAGKGTLAQRLVGTLKVPQISTGDMLRAARDEGTDLGKKAAGYMSSGQLVPDDLVIALVKDRLSRPDCAEGYILDGFPRTRPQAEAMDAAGIGVDLAANLVLDPEVIVKRLAGRRSCPSCGKVYHVEFQPPANGSNCDACGTEVTIREDDRPETVRNRLRIYDEKTAPLVDFYLGKGLLKNIDGSGGADKVLAAILKVL